MNDLISRQAVIEINRSYHGQMPNEVNHRIWKEINELPSTQPELAKNSPKVNSDSGELISRQAAIDYCYQLINVEYEQGSDEMNYGQERVNQTETILHHLEIMPSAQSERESIKWIPHESIFGGSDERVYTCDKCGYNIGFHVENFCPNCGGKYERYEKKEGER